MKNIILFSLILLMGFSQMSFAHPKKSIDIVECNLIDVEPQNGDAILVFEIICSLSGMKDSQLAFGIVPLDENMDMIYDDEGNLIISGQDYQISKDTGEGAVDASIPLSFFPKNMEKYLYKCIIIDGDTLEAISEKGPFSFSSEDLSNNIAQQLNDQITDFFNLLGGRSGSDGSDYDEKFDKDGFRICDECKGAKECRQCHGNGIWAQEKCPECDGTGKCRRCDGKGTLYFSF